MVNFFVMDFSDIELHSYYGNKLQTENI